MYQPELNQDEVYSRFMSFGGLFRHDLREYDTDFEDVLNFTMNDTSPAFKNVLSTDGEKQLTHTIYTHDTLLFPNDNCPITCTAFKEGDPVIQLPCKHAYEPESIVRWLKEEKAECPTCRYKLESTEVRMADTSQADTSQADNDYAHTEPMFTRTALEIVTEHIQSIPTELIHFVYNFREHTSFAEESIPVNSDFGRHFR